MRPDALTQLPLSPELLGIVGLLPMVVAAIVLGKLFCGKQNVANLL